MAEHEASSTLPWLVGIPVAGGFLGWGIVHLYGSVGWNTPLNQDFTHVGASGLDNIGMLPPFAGAVASIAAGVALMVWLNATAWRKTGGY
jgi:hypothetical protein